MSRPTGASMTLSIWAEVHLFAKGGHAFGLRRKEHPVSSWPSLVESWLKEIGIL